MVKGAFVAGVFLALTGLAAGAWPAESARERSWKLVPKRTYDRRGPTVLIHGTDRVREAYGEALSVTILLGADGYWVRPSRDYLTRERLEAAKVLVVDRAWNSVGDWRTSTLLSRWIHEGGSVLVLARGAGPQARHQLGAGRVAVVDPAAFGATDFVEHLLAAMHWLSSEANFGATK